MNIILASILSRNITKENNDFNIKAASVRKVNKIMV